jgi:putative endonuclease
LNAGFDGGGELAQNQKQRVGSWGEAVAASFLENRGYRILARNVRTGAGEIDLIARQLGRGGTGCLVFVEVKTRTGPGFGLPEEAVDLRKLEHVFHSAEKYLEEHSELCGEDWRIDVIAIQGRPGARVEDMHIEHFENISA